MKRQYYSFIILFVIFILASCSPKVQESTTSVEPPKEEVVKELDPNGCIKFNDLNAGDADAITTEYALYRDAIKLEKFKEAYPRWKNVYNTAPSTNGRNDNVFRDGIKIYMDFYKNTSNESLQNKYLDTLNMIYEKAITCFPNKKSYYMSKQGADMFYKFKGKMPKPEMYQLLKTAVNMDQNDSRVRTIIPFASLNYSLYADDEINIEDTRKTHETIQNIVKYNIENCKDEKKCNAWTQVEQYIVGLSERFENQKGFYDCNYFLDKFYYQFEEDPKNCDLIEDLYRQLRRSGCDKENSKLVTLENAYKESCIQGPPQNPCRLALEEERYRDAIDCYDELIKNNPDKVDLNATLLLRNAKIHYAHTRKFSKAREYARKAIKLKPNWGAPYILIGKLYASSGPLCGPGTGWDSQIVTWVAIDKWNKAKRVDPSVANEANRLIRQYSKYMPSKGDIFQRNLTEGGTYKVKCWIQETTTIRAAKK